MEGKLARRHSAHISERIFAELGWDYSGASLESWVAGGESTLQSNCLPFVSRREL